MRLDSVRDLKRRLLHKLVDPFAAQAKQIGPMGVTAASAASAVTRFVGDEASFGIAARPFDALPQIHRSIALGIAPHGGGYRLAIRLQRAALRNSPLVERLTREAHGEVDLRLVGRIDKRARRTAPWYRNNVRPLLIGASVGHISVTAGSIGGFARRGGSVYLLSNNHVIANENRASSGDWIIQRGALDGGRRPADNVARLRHWVRLRRTGSNYVDAALGALESGIEYDSVELRGIANGKSRRLAGVGPELLDEGTIVYKIGRTTGATKGRVAAFDVDNLVVNFDVGNVRFDGQIEIESIAKRPFSDGGDSGSLIVDSEMRAVALLFAGSELGGRHNVGLTYANPIHRVLGDLKATLLP